MEFTLKQLVEDLSQQQGQQTTTKPSIFSSQLPLTKEQLKDLSADVIEPTDKLVDSIRNIRAVSLQVMDSRSRIDQLLGQIQ